MGGKDWARWTHSAHNRDLNRYRSVVGERAGPRMRQRPQQKKDGQRDYLCDQYALPATSYLRALRSRGVAAFVDVSKAWSCVAPLRLGKPLLSDPRPTKPLLI